MITFKFPKQEKWGSLCRNTTPWNLNSISPSETVYEVASMCAYMHVCVCICTHICVRLEKKEMEVTEEGKETL